MGFSIAIGAGEGIAALQAVAALHGKTGHD
jgi:hypothetical protein